LPLSVVEGTCEGIHGAVFESAGVQRPRRTRRQGWRAADPSGALDGWKSNPGSRAGSTRR